MPGHSVPNIPCAGCGKLLWGGGGKQAVPGKKTCRPCRAELARPRHLSRTPRAQKKVRPTRTKRRRVTAVVVAPGTATDHLADILTALRGEDRVRTLVVLSRLATISPSYYERWSHRDLRITLASSGIEVLKSNGVMVVRNPGEVVHHRPSNALSTGQERRHLAELTGDRITVSELGERDNWRCHICLRKVARRTAACAARSPSVDHLVPISRGGLHVWQNVALAHLGCNMRRSDSGAAQLQMF